MGTSGRAGVLAAAAGLSRASVWAPEWRATFDRALAREVEERRFFLWLPVAAMGGVALNLSADSEPALWAPLALTLVFSALAYLSRARPVAFGVTLALAALFGGFLAMSLRTVRVAAPVLDRIRIVSLTGTVEEVDLRPVGARMVIAIASADGMPAQKVPRRIRVTTRKTPDVAAGDFVSLKARLLPPSHASLPGGYDFARDAFFAGVGAVGSTLGTIKVLPPPADASLRQRFAAAIDHARNRLAVRVDRVIGGDEGAIAAAMVTGKRDFLSNDAKDLIREAGIFHIITISGVQMTLVAGILFVVARRLLALSPALALNYPIKKWAAVVAMAGSLLYDIATGSRVGTERALVMTLIVLGAVLLDRRALTMRNLAFAVIAVIVIEPEAILGVSFQLSFAAVAALVAVMEARLAGMDPDPNPYLPQRGRPPPRTLMEDLLRKPAALLVATVCATSATASFMAYHFHDLSPYVLIGNPLTLSIIEFFAVPGALLGAALYPLGLDAPVWLYVGAGIKFILWAARFIAAAPGSTVHVRAFAPFAIAVPGARGDERHHLADLGVSGQRHPLRPRRPDRRGERPALRRDRRALGRSGGGARRRRQADDRRQALQRLRRRAVADRRRRRTRPGSGARPGRALRPARLRRRAARGRVAERCPRSPGLRGGLRARRDCRQRRSPRPAIAGRNSCSTRRPWRSSARSGLTWSDDKGFALAADRTALQNRPWSPLPPPAPNDRIVRPGHPTHGAEPADPD